MRELIGRLRGVAGRIEHRQMLVARTLREAAAALEDAREDVEAARTAITTAPKCRLLEVQSLGFDDPDRPVLEWMIKSGKRFRIVDDAAIDQARGKGGGEVGP